MTSRWGEPMARGRESEKERVAAFARWFAERPGGWTDEDLAAYLGAVDGEPDRALRSWALGFLVEHEGLTASQLRRLAEHRLVLENPKHLEFLRRNLDAKQSSTLGEE